MIKVQTEQERIAEGNELIAVFMGLQKYSGKYFSDTNRYKKAQLKFHSSWDWLMPVVEKIESLGYYTNIYKADDLHEMQVWDGTPTYKRTERNIIVQSDIGRYCHKAEAIYNTIINFINWYNQYTELSVNLEKVKV